MVSWPSWKAPDMKDGAPTSRLDGPKIERTACCSTSDRPQVASSVSSGRPYRKRMMPRSMAMPTAPATTKASGRAITSEASNRCGNEVRMMSCTTKVV